MAPDRPGGLAMIGRQVLRMRLYYGWSQAELARRAGASQATISRIERGVHRGLSIGRLAAVLDALHVADVIFERPPTLRRQRSRSCCSAIDGSEPGSCQVGA